jgi:hypothetical protein
MKIQDKKDAQKFADIKITRTFASLLKNKATLK